MSNFNFFTAPKPATTQTVSKPSIFSIGSKKAPVKAAENIVEEEKEVAASIKEEVISAVETKETEVVEVKEEVVAETTEQAEEKSEDSVEAVQEEAQPEKKKRTRKSKTESQETSCDKKEEAKGQEEKPITYTNAKFEPAKIKLSAIQKSFSISIEDEKWEEKKKELSERVENIKISEDINLGSVRILLAQCVNLYSDLKREQRESRVFYNVMLDKTVGLISRQKDLNAIGSNAAERDKNSVKSCEQFKMKTERGEYNLYDIAMIVQDRIETINDLLDDLKQKREALSSYIYVLKLESESSK